MWKRIKLNHLAFMFIILQLILETMAGTKNSTKDAQKQAALPPCAACTVLTESFKKGMERTARNKFEGGDTDWEEKKMGTYKKSEVRLIEIQEKLCAEVERGQNQCQSNMEKHENLIEDWWHNYQDDDELHKWLCIDTLKVCCPTNHYGPQCLPCKGGSEVVCGGNGKCKGSGTRKGNGECLCNTGYNGALCDSCASNYFEAYRDDSKLLCEHCHKACNGPCSGAGAQSCIACTTGWMMEPEKGCIDVNECISGNPPCSSNNEFCVNNEGSYTCLKCDKSCNGCHGDGPDMCTKCAEGFTLDKDVCVDNRGEERESHLAFARYITYAGLTIATCIIFQKHTMMAAVVGLGVASYISFSEYYLMHMETNDGKKADLSQLPLGFTTEKVR